MKLTLALAFCLFGLAAAGVVKVNLDNEWQDFKQRFAKSYRHDAEEATRRATWEKNLAFIEKHNAEFEQGLHTFTVGVNVHADLTVEEFAALLNGFNKTKNLYASKTKNIYVPNHKDAPPASVDWRPKGYVTGVKDQGQCGSCWAFSATGSLEGQTFKKTGKLVSLSEQNIVDCDDTSYGCMGGLMENAFNYVKSNGGVDTEASYPYTARGGDCLFKKEDIGATCTGFVNIKQGDEDDLLNAVANVGPISVAIDAGHSSFQLYKKGIYYEPHCSSTELDHGVLAVGYGSDGDKDFWIVKNSWGTSWGDEGYIQMSRNKKNNCGIATDASYPTV